MFGFLSPRPHPDSYRHAYARLCVHQRRAFGLRSLPFHSYEAVFLYQLALDAGAFPAGVMPAVRCCKLARPGNLTSAADAPHGRFAAAVALLLAGIKLDDDVADSGSWAARGVRFVLKGRIRKAHDELRNYDPAFDATVTGFLAAHGKLEQPDRGTGLQAGGLPLERYVEPTAAAFGYVFGLAAKLPGMNGHLDSLTAIGSGVGAALIAFDCAADWESDRKRGHFNPLPDATAVRAAMRFAVERLDDVADLCRTAFGSCSTAAHTATAVADRLAEMNPFRSTCPAVPAWKQAWHMLKRSAVGGPQLALAGPMASAGNTDGDTAPADTGGGGWKSRRKRKQESEEEAKPEGGGDGGKSSSNAANDTCCGVTCCALQGGGDCAECCCAIGACA